MRKMPRGFTDSEKEKIRENLIGACQKRWSRYGYKKTSVEELCRKAGISKGAFYLFFESKEALFCEALSRMQEEIRDGASRIIDERPDHFGVSEAVKFVYRAYDENNFLRDSDSADFAALMDKLPEAQRRRLMRSEEKNRNLFLEKSCLRLKPQVSCNMFSCFSFFLLQGRSGLLLAPICVHFRHRARGMLPYLRCWFVNFGHSAPAHPGFPLRERNTAHLSYAEIRAA